MFNNIGEKTFYVFGAVNAISIPIVWALYPESNQRTLEQMDLLFAADSWWTWDAERNFARLQAENPELVQAATRGNSVIDPETGMKRNFSSRHASLVPGARDASSTESDEKVRVEGVESVKRG